MQENSQDAVLKKLKKFKREDIIFSPHAGVRAAMRGITHKEVLDRLSNPEDLVYAEPDGDIGRGERFKCYFEVSKRIYHLYIIVISKDGIKVVTVFLANKSKQRKLAKYSKIPPQY